jgi:hypothetical protein
MRYGCLILLVSSSLAWLSAKAQTPTDKAATQPPKTQATASPESGSEVKPDTAVITINGLCDSGLATSTHPVPLPPAPGFSKAIDPGCKTVITREQYEKLLDGVGLPASYYHGSTRAHEYANTLVFAEKGRELQVEKDPRFQQKARYSYVQDLNQYALIHMQDQANDISDADVEKYRKEHPERFVRSHIFQIAVPKFKEHDAGGNTSAKPDPAEQAEMHKAALDLQKEAVAGADPDELEEKAYKIAGSEAVPDTDLGIQVPDQIPIEYRKLLFDLKPGEVSQVIENDHEYLFFKCTEKENIPAAESKSFMGFLRMRDARRTMKDGVQMQFNEDYFGPPGSQEEAEGNSSQ